MKLPDDKWEEIEPGIYRLRAYTPEQIEMLSQRPTELINRALSNAIRKSSVTSQGGKATI